MSQEQIQVPKGWKVKDLVDVIQPLENGSRPKGGAKGITEGIPSLGGEHLNYNGGFNFGNINQNYNNQSISLEEAYKILNLNPKKKYTKEHVMNSYKKIMKKIHPDISPELSRLASIVNEAKDTVIKDIS